MQKQIIGLTGYYASGKSTVAKIFEEDGYLIIELDEIGHIALEKKKEIVVKTFGSSILYQNDKDKSKVNRKRLREIVFEDKNKLKELERIVHPVIIEEVKTIIKNTTRNKILICAAILIEANIQRLCTKTILVWSPFKSLLHRGQLRDALSKQQIRNVLKNQMPLKKRLRFVDYVIRNSSSYEELYKNTKQIIYKLGWISL